MKSRFQITLSDVEVLVLAIWLKQVSDTTYTDEETRHASRDLRDRLVYAFSAQVPHLAVHEIAYGDFT